MKSVNLKGTCFASRTIRPSPVCYRTPSEPRASAGTIESNPLVPALGVGKNLLPSGTRRRVLTYSRHFASSRYKEREAGPDPVKTTRAEQRQGSTGKLDEAVW